MFNLYSKIPNYITNFCNTFDVSIDIMSKWSFAESSNRTNLISGCGGIGRYQIKVIHFKYYLFLTSQNASNIKCITNFLLSDWNNSYITIWFVNFYRNRGFSMREIIQIWLFGIKNVYEHNRWSYSYQEKIFGDREKRVLNLESYNKLMGK